MPDYKFRKRNKLDVILTDSRPVELPANYSLVYFYNYLNSCPKMKKLLKSIKTELRASQLQKEGEYWGPEWHAVPLKYHIIKNRFETREMSLLSPISMIELPLFLEAFEKQLLILTSEGGFSIRKHEINDGLRYKEVVSGHGIKYEYPSDMSIEATGSFFNIAPYKYLKDFYKSNEWDQLNREYRNFGKIDFSKCFDSIYTHTYTWLITKNSVDGKGYGNNSYFLNVCDKLLQNFNGSVTNGIVVGPEFSRLMMELLAQHIDNKVKERLQQEGLTQVEDYYICRYIDDIFIFADEEKNVERIIEIYRDEAELFHFRLNDKKRFMGKLPYKWFGWKEKAHSVNEYVSDTLFGNTKDSKYIIKYRPNMIPHMKMLYQNLMSDYPDEQDKIAAYILSTIYKKINRTDKELLSGEKIIGKLIGFLESIFFFYSYSLSYNNTEKLISILNSVGNSVPEEIFKDSLHKVLCCYSISLAKANPEDIVNLLLLVAMYGIELPDDVENMLNKKVVKNGNPLMHAAVLIYFQYNDKKKKEFKAIVENKIKNAISCIYRNDKFFEYPEVWWIYLFFDCPFISKECRNEIEKIVIEQEAFLNYALNERLRKKMVVKKALTAKMMTIDFLLHCGSKNKFINWGMKKEELFDYAVFTTYQRTLFNGYKEKLEIDDDGFSYWY
ncbi:RNA-directed DNA polymerase [Butyrivibrio proteoclasticus]|uniref:RNA-directed DNA polymerase n=1 Tax=Butyrivibrio proteoclasticus TaxID=43305 RepID=UPI00047EABC5|nr:RNA-directed DNA polymerase [Butyrivibrio proteoclasticus]